jgi:hypothetical protein
LTTVGCLVKVKKLINPLNQLDLTDSAGADKTAVACLSGRPRPIALINLLQNPGSDETGATGVGRTAVACPLGRPRPIALINLLQNPGPFTTGSTGSAEADLVEDGN